MPFPFRALAPLALLCFATPVAAAPLSTSERSNVDRIVADTLKKTGVPSASVAVVRDGQIAYAKAYGRQAEDAHAPAADLRYPVASVSKQFTAAAILLLRDDGKLSLDDHVSTWVPGITDGDQITIRQLLSHTSGLQDYWPQDYSFAAMQTPTTPRGILDRWAKKPLDFAPGTQWQYSNTGFVVAGLIAEKAAGEPLLAFLQHRLFDRIGMNPIDQDAAIGPAYPTGHHRFGLGPVRVTPPAAPGWFFAMGELAMTASDLARWDIARLDRAVMSKANWAEQETPVLLRNGTSTGYGLGVEAGTEKKQRAISHDGEGAGFLAHNIVFPESRSAVVVLVNADFADAQTAIAEQIEDKVLFPAPAGAKDDDGAAWTARARRTFDDLRAGRVDRAGLTEDARFYFTSTALADFKASLAKLGPPKSFAPIRGPRLRGGFVNRNYMVEYGTTKLVVVSYAEPGPTGRWEQFIVMPAS